MTSLPPDAPLVLRIELRQGSDMTGSVPVAFPEIVIRGDQAGLRHLRRQISRIIRWTQSSPDAHTHVLDGDRPGITASPANLVLTIEGTAEAPGG